jgi:hypothetical protein
LPALFGLLLAPVGALIGSVLFFLVIGLFQNGGPIWPWDWLRIVLFGTAIGMIPALPTSAIVLPAAYGILRRRGSATPRRVAAVGAVAGFVISGGILLAFWSQGNQAKDPLFWAIIGGVGLDGAIAGGCVGTALSAIMRRYARAAPDETTG